MIKFILLGLFVVYLISPLMRCIVKNIHLCGIYSFIDLVDYVRLRKWEDFNLYGIDLFIYRNVWSWKNAIYDS